MSFFGQKSCIVTAVAGPEFCHFWRLKLVILETKWNRLEIFCYGDRSHIRVQLPMKYYLGAAKLEVTGGQNVISWNLNTSQHTIPLNLILK